MESYLYVIANRTNAKFFLRDQTTHGKLQLITVMDNPDGRLHDRDLNPQVSGRWSYRGEYDQKQDQVTQRFVKKISQYIERLKYVNKYDSLVIIAEPKLLGIINKSILRFIKSIKSLQWVRKDISYYSSYEISQFLGFPLGKKF